MSIIDRILDIFRRNKFEDVHPKAEEIVGTNPARVSTATENMNYVYSHGFTNGAYRVATDKDDFEDFLLASSECDRVAEERKQNEYKLNDVKRQLTTGLTIHQNMQDILIEKTKSHEHLKIKIEENDQSRFAEVEKQKAIIEQRRSIHAEYGWVPALLYLFAGIVFIVGDISITHQITSWGFDMKGIEGWVFAVGLAFTAFLIKPVFDRLLEKPFQKAGLEMKKIYKGVLMLITVLGLVMLFLLGKFRSESQVAATKLGDLNYQMQSLSDPNSPEYIKLADERKKINEALTSNPVGEWGIILSGIIFAIGGALCMSIAFPSLGHLINRYWLLPFRISNYERKIIKLHKDRNELRSELKIVAGEMLKAEHKLKGYDFERIKNEIAALEEEEKKLIRAYYDEQFRKEKFLYQDGRNRGEKFDIDTALVYKAMEHDPTDLYHKNGKAQTDNNKGPRRPFVKIRKMIADQYKNQTNHSPDDNEFEILS